MHSPERLGMQSTKEKIRKAVQEYVKLFPSEYEAFLNSTREKNDNKLNDWAETEQTDMLTRHLIDIPETLFFVFQKHLRQEERDWLYGKNTYQGKQQGMAWFMRAFPQFKITKDF